MAQFRNSADKSPKQNQYTANRQTVKPEQPNNRSDTSGQTFSRNAYAAQSNRADRANLDDFNLSTKGKKRGAGNAFTNFFRNHYKMLLIILGALVIAAAAGAIWYYLYIDKTIQDPEVEIARQELTKPAPGDPYYILLLGKDVGEERSNDTGRTDTMILARIDEVNQKAALISLPRDLMIEMSGYGTQKLNAAYTYGELEDGHSGYEFLLREVKKLAGVDIAGYLCINFDGFKDIVSSLGGVEVDVPVDIIGDANANDGITAINVYAGLQKLTADEAFTFVRSRQFPNGDYQRQANQRTFLQALAAQVLKSDLLTIGNTVRAVANALTTNFNLSDLIRMAQAMSDISANDLYTYTVPAYGDMINGVSYLVANITAFQTMMRGIDAGLYPEQAGGEVFLGTYSDNYYAWGKAGATDTSAVNPRNYTVDVKNGGGIAGSASSTSDLLAIAGYKQGFIGNASNYAYTDTLIIYRSTDNNALVAEDILQRLGFGRIIKSQDQYVFDGDILVVVGSDYK